MKKNYQVPEGGNYFLMETMYLDSRFPYMPISEITDLECKWPSPLN